MSMNMAGFIDFKIFRIYSVYFISIIYCLTSLPLTTVAFEDTTSTSTTNYSTVLVSGNNITIEASPAQARDRKRGPNSNVVPWAHLKPHHSNEQVMGEQGTEVPMRSFTEMAKFRTNQMTGIRPADRNAYKNMNHLKRRGPRIFQRPESEIGHVSDMNTLEESAAFPYHLSSMPNRVPNTMLRHRDDIFRSHGQVHNSKVRMNPKPSKLPGLPPHCHECLRSDSNVNPVVKPDFDVVGGNEKFFPEGSADLHMPVMDRDIQSTDDFNGNGLENIEEFSESALSHTGVTYTPEDVTSTQPLAFSNDKFANVFNIKGNSNHFYFLMPNGSAASTINGLRAGMESMGTHTQDAQCTERCMQMQNRGHFGHKIANCGCRSNNVADSRNSFALQDQGQHSVNTQQNHLTKNAGKPNEKQSGSPATMEDILPLLKLLQESQKVKEVALPAATKKLSKTTTATSLTEGVTESFEDTEEEDEDKVSSDEIKSKTGSQSAEKKSMLFEEFLSGKLL